MKRALELCERGRPRETFCEELKEDIQLVYTYDKLIREDTEWHEQLMDSKRKKIKEYFEKYNRD